MKQIKCPACNYAISIDAKRYPAGKALIITCPKCGKRFGIRLKKAEEQTEEPLPDSIEEEPQQPDCGSITVIENVFHYKQVFPLSMGDNTIGRKMGKVGANLAIATDDPSVDITHCCITVKHDKTGGLQYILRDGPSNTGTFVDNEILGDRERRIISSGTLFTIGATSIILKGPGEE